jgi:hypothetical protein
MHSSSTTSLSSQGFSSFYLERHYSWEDIVVEESAKTSGLMHTEFEYIAHFVTCTGRTFSIL